MGETSGRPVAEPGEPGWAARVADQLAELLPGVSLSRARDVARSTFWLVPALCVAAAIGLAIGLIALDQALPVTHGAVLVFPGPPEGARSFLSSIIQAMISFTGLVFSITIVVLQLSSGQFSPRVLRMFLSDRTIRWALGVFVATFVYAMVVLRAVRGTSTGGGFVPRIAVTVAFGFVLASVALFIRYISHVANMIRVATVITYVGGQARQIISSRYPASGAEPESVPALPQPARTIAAPRGGVLVSVNENRLVRAGAEAGCVLAVVPRVGDFVPAGAPLVTVHPEPELARRDLDAAGELILSGVALDTERSMEQDLAFGFRQLVDIAERALSPAVNDPTTAVQAIDVLHDLLRALATRTLPAGCWRDAGGQVRLVVPQYRYADFLDLAVGEIWHYGASAAQVPGRLAAMRDDLYAAALPVYLPAITAWSRRVADVQLIGPGA
ncbi:MAG: DUF2254 domain-containing protein [Streptosporangiaceae bacterium]